MTLPVMAGKMLAEARMRHHDFDILSRASLYAPVLYDKFIAGMDPEQRQLYIHWWLCWQQQPVDEDD